MVFVWRIFSPHLGGDLKRKFYHAQTPPSIQIKNAAICAQFADVISNTIVQWVASGVLSVWGEVGVVSPPHLVLPITIEPSKPRLCHDERFLNLWIRDLPFKLDHLADLPRCVLPGHFQTTFDDKSGYQHVRLHPSSETYFGLEWDNFFFVFRTLPFGRKASAYIYHNLGLVVSHTARSLGVPLSQYIDDRHVGQLFASPMRSVILPSTQTAEAEAYIVCYILIEAGSVMPLNARGVEFFLRTGEGSSPETIGWMLRMILTLSRLRLWHAHSWLSETMYVILGLIFILIIEPSRPPWTILAARIPLLTILSRKS